MMQDRNEAGGILLLALEGGGLESKARWSQ